MDRLKPGYLLRTLGILLTAALLVSQVACSDQKSDTAQLVRTVKLAKPPMQTAWRADGKRFLADGFGSLAVWDTATGEQIATPQMWVASQSVLYSPDGRLLVLHKAGKNYKDMGALVWLDAKNHHVIREFEDMYPIDYGNAFSPDSRLLVVVADKKNGYRNVAAVLNVETGTVVAELKTLHTDPKAKGEDFIQRMVYSPDGATVMIGFITGKIDVWSTKDWQLIKTFKAHKGYIFSMAISPNGKWLATGSNSSGGIGWSYDPDTKIKTETKYDDPIKIWDTATWEQVKALPIRDKPTSSLAFLPDGKHLVSANADRILFWDVPTEKQVGIIKGFKDGGGLNFALSQDGQYLAVGGIGTLEAQVWKIIGAQLHN